MFLFWWTGKGYYTFGVIVVVWLVFAVLLQLGLPLLEDRPWFWGLALVVSAVVNWTVGTRVNRKRLALPRAPGIKGRLFYKARHRFMSMPMESFSIVIAATGLGVIIWGFISPSAYP